MKQVYIDINYPNFDINKYKDFNGQSFADFVFQFFPWIKYEIRTNNSSSAYYIIGIVNKDLINESKQSSKRCIQQRISRSPSPQLQFILKFIKDTCKGKNLHLDISILKQNYVMKQFPNFNQKKYGISTFGDFIRKYFPEFILEQHRSSTYITGVATKKEIQQKQNEQNDLNKQIDDVRKEDLEIKAYLKGIKDESKQ